MVDVLGTHFDGPIQNREDVIWGASRMLMGAPETYFRKNIATLEELITKHFHQPRWIII